MKNKQTKPTAVHIFTSLHYHYNQSSDWQTKSQDISKTRQPATGIKNNREFSHYGTGGGSRIYIFLFAERKSPTLLIDFGCYLLCKDALNQI